MQEEVVEDVSTEAEDLFEEGNDGCPIQQLEEFLEHSGFRRYKPVLYGLTSERSFDGFIVACLAHGPIQFEREDGEDVVVFFVSSNRLEAERGNKRIYEALYPYYVVSLLRGGVAVEGIR